MFRVVDEPRVRAHAEKFVAWASLILTALSMWEKISHYLKLAKQRNRKKKHPLGFRA